MRVFILVMLAVTVMNAAKASDQYQACIEEQRELIYENADSYIDVAEQFVEVYEYCADVKLSEYK